MHPTTAAAIVQDRQRDFRARGTRARFARRARLDARIRPGLIRRGLGRMQTAQLRSKRPATRAAAAPVRSMPRPDGLPSTVR